MTARMHKDAIASAEKAENWLLLDRFTGTEDIQSFGASTNEVPAVGGFLTRRTLPLRPAWPSSFIFLYQTLRFIPEYHDFDKVIHASSIRSRASLAPRVLLAPDFHPPSLLFVLFTRWPVDDTWVTSGQHGSRVIANQCSLCGPGCHLVAYCTSVSRPIRASAIQLDSLSLPVIAMSVACFGPMGAWRFGTRLVRVW
jgi:hypothetical protein